MSVEQGGRAYTACSARARSRRVVAAGILGLALLFVLAGPRARAAPAHTVLLTLVAGKTPVAGGYNFNGYADGDLIVTVPLGWTVTVRFENAAAPPHSVAVLPYSDPQPAEGTHPAFPGAATPDLQHGLPRGTVATFSFVASRPGTYEFACGVAGHAIAGMWATLVISPTATTAATQIRPPKPVSSPPGAASGRAAAPDPGLPGNVLIADAGNNRVIEVTPDKRIVWEFPRPGDLEPGQAFVDPDDAFYTPGGRTIITNEEDNHTIALIDYVAHKIIWEYGHPGQPGSGPGYLNTPDDAYQLPDGRIVVADIKNCRILVLDPPPAHHIQRQFGATKDCRASSGHFLYPNGDTPLPGGRLLITEIGTRSAAELDLVTGRILRRIPLPVAYPSDTQPTRDGGYVVADYSRPGKVVVVDRSGRMEWSYAPTTGPGRLDHPSLALELPNGNIILNDDYDHRVMVIGRDKKILWQYGVTGIPGSAPGYLRIPDGVDVKPASFGR